MARNAPKKEKETTNRLSEIPRMEAAPMRMAKTAADKPSEKRLDATKGRDQSGQAADSKRAAADQQSQTQLSTDRFAGEEPTQLQAAGKQRVAAPAAAAPQTGGAGVVGGTPAQAAAIVGRVTGLADCKWAEPASATQLASSVCAGRKFALAAGFLEITYDSGAKVILEGPCAYRFAALNGGFLEVGKLTVRTARPPASAFVISTPTAVVADIDGETGVEVGKSGATLSHVYRGRANMRVPVAGLGATATAIVLTAGQAASAQPTSSGVLNLSRVPASTSSSFVRAMPSGKSTPTVPGAVGISNVLIVRCDITPETLKQETFDNILDDNHIAWHVQSDKAMDSREAGAEKDKAESWREIAIVASPTPAQLNAVLAAMKAKPDIFGAVRQELPNKVASRADKSESNAAPAETATPPEKVVFVLRVLKPKHETQRPAK
jgi:hypothetical protein